MNDLLTYVIEHFFDSRQEFLNKLSTPEQLKSKDVIEYVRSNMKGSKTKQGAFLREGALYFLNAMAKEGGALDRGKPGTVAPGYAFEGGKREYGRVRGDAPLRKVERPLIVPDVDYPGVPMSRLVDVVISEALTLFRSWSNRNKPRFFEYKPANPMTGDSVEVEQLMELYEDHANRFNRLHELIIEHNDAKEIYFDAKKGKLPPAQSGLKTGITINRAAQAKWLCLKLRIKSGATWTMYSNSVGKLGRLLSRAGVPCMASTYGKLWDLWAVLPDEMSMPDAYDLIGGIEGITRIGKTSKGVGFRSLLLDSVIIDESTFSDDTCIFPLSLHIHRGKEKVATKKEGEGNLDFTIDTGLSMVPVMGTLAQFDMGIDNHPLQAMYNAPGHLARVYHYARMTELIPQLHSSQPLLEIDTDASNPARDYWSSLKQMDQDDFWEGELKTIPEGRDVTLVYDGIKAYIKGLPNDKKLTNILHTDEFEQLCVGPRTVYARIQGKDANALVAMLSQLDEGDYDEDKIRNAFANRIISIWGGDGSIESLSGRHIQAVKQAKPDDLEEMMSFAPAGVIGTVSGEERILFRKETTPVIVLGYEKNSVINNEARVLIVGKVVKEKVDVLVRGKIKPTRKAGEQIRDEYQEVARVGSFSGFTYEDRKELLAYMESLNYRREIEGDILIDPVEANIIFEMEFKGLLADKPMWRYNRKASRREVSVKQELPAKGERQVKGVQTRYTMEPLEKNSIPQYNNPKIIGYRTEMGREEQRIFPYLIPSSDVTYGVTMKDNPPVQLSKYTSYKEKADSGMLAVLGFRSPEYAKEDLSEFRKKMRTKFGDTITVVQSGSTLVAHKKGAKIGEKCENCGAPKAFSPPATITQERAADEGPAVRFMCDVCGRQTYQRDRRNPSLVSVEESYGDMDFAQKIIGYDKNNELNPEVKPYLHTNWPSWYRRTERDLIVRGLDRFDYVGVIEGFVNKTGSTYYNTMYNIAKRNKGKPLIANRKEHQQLALLYSMCHNDLELIVAWPNATSSKEIGRFETDLEKSGTIVYQKEIKLTKNAAEILCMQMYAGESFLSKEQCIKKALASGWTRNDTKDDERKLRIYLLYNDSEKSLRGKASPRKEELRDIFRTSDTDRKSYIHTADNSVQVTEYAQIFFNENSLYLLSNNNIKLLLPSKPNKEWLMINSMKKYIQQEFGSLFLLNSMMKSGSGAYLHGIRKTSDVDLMIDDRRLGSETKQKMETLKELMPWFDYSLAYSGRDSEKFWDYETYVPGKTFYDKRSEMTHNPEHHAYFCGLKVETPKGFLYQRMARVSEDSRPRAAADMIMMPVFWDEGRFRKLEKDYKFFLDWGDLEYQYVYDIRDYFQTIKWFIKTRYNRDFSHKDIFNMLQTFRYKTNPLDTDAIEERLIASVDGRFVNMDETRNNPPQQKIVITVPHALPAGDNVKDHWCDWSAAPAARQLYKNLSKDYKLQLHLADKKRTEIDYNRIISSPTRWQKELDQFLETADMLVDVHSYPKDDVIWAGYDFALFNSDKWPEERQLEQVELMTFLQNKGYKVFMDIADHRNYIQEKGIEKGIPSFLVEFNEDMDLTQPTSDLAEGLSVVLAKDNPPKCKFCGNPLKNPMTPETPHGNVFDRSGIAIGKDSPLVSLVPVVESIDQFYAGIECSYCAKTNPVLPLKKHGRFDTPALKSEIESEKIQHEEIRKHQKRHDTLVQSIMKKDFDKSWTWNRPVAESKQKAEKKALAKAVKKADKELHDLLCTKDNGKPCKNWYGRKRRKTKIEPKAWHEMDSAASECKIGSYKVCRTDCYVCYTEQVKQNPKRNPSVKELTPSKLSSILPTGNEIVAKATIESLLNGKIPATKAGLSKFPVEYMLMEYDQYILDNKMDSIFVEHLSDEPNPQILKNASALMQLPEFKKKYPSSKYVKFTPAEKSDFAGLLYIIPKKQFNRKVKSFVKKQGSVLVKRNPTPHFFPGDAVVKYPWLKYSNLISTNPLDKDLYDWFEEWCNLVNMTNEELETFLNSNWGKVAGLSKQEAKNWNDIKSGRVSGRRILKMRKKIGITKPGDYIKGDLAIGKAWEKALKNWTGPSDDAIKGETDWDWCKRQVRFNKRAGAFPYNDDAEDRKGPLVKKQKTQNQPSRRLLSLWVWGHDPWRWASDNGIARMPKCPDTDWVGGKEKRKYGKIEVMAGPKKNFLMTLPYLYSQVFRGLVYAEEGIEPKENPPAENITWTTKSVKMRIPEISRAGAILGNVFVLEGTDKDGNTVSLKTNKYSTEDEYDFTNSAIAAQEWLKGLGVKSYAYVVGIEASKKGLGLGQAAYLKMAEIAPAVLSTTHTQDAENAWQAIDRRASDYGMVVHKRKIVRKTSKSRGDEWDGEEYRFDRVLMKNGKENPPIFPEPQRVSGVKGGKYRTEDGQDVSGFHFENAVILGHDKSINVEWIHQQKKPEPKPAPKSGLRRIRFNMLRPNKFDGYKDHWIVASETSQGHIYSLSAEIHTTLTLQTFPNKKSEPRLRPETYGIITPLNKIGEITIKTSGKKHPLYDRVFVSDSKMNPNQDFNKIVRNFVQSLDPSIQFTSSSLEERLKNAGYKRSGARTIGRILPQMERERRVIRVGTSAVFRNTERMYQEYLDMQEKTHRNKNNPRTKKGRKVPTRYLKGLNKVEKAIAKYEIDKGYEYDIDDPEAYEFWKSDIMAKARGMENQPSRWKLQFIEKYGPLPKGKDLVSRLAKATGIKKKYIQKAYDKGLAAWRGGHRPGTSQHQWASGRAYALVMGGTGSTAKGQPDFKLAVEAGVRNEKGKLLI